MLLFVPILFLFFPRVKKKNVYPKKKKRIRLLRSALTHFVRLWMYISKRLTAFFGLEVREMESGSSIWNKPRITKIGNPRVRNMLYMAALVVIRHNAKMSDFYFRLVNKGKPKKLYLYSQLK